MHDREPLCQTLASARRGTYERRQFRAPHGGGTSRSIGRGHGPEANYGGTEEERIAPGAQSKGNSTAEFLLRQPGARECESCCGSGTLLQNMRVTLPTLVSPCPSVPCASFFLDAKINQTWRYGSHLM